MQHYRPYRDAVEKTVVNAVATGRRVLHISCHSFTPVLHGVRRNADIGLLYDPARKSESEMSDCWQQQLALLAPQWKVRRNYPYRGTSDGLTAYLRRRFGDGSYCGIEIEINQACVVGPDVHWRAMQRVVIDALQKAARSSIYLPLP
jgi:predicted N-formylglutamate amidohydrolase